MNLSGYFFRRGCRWWARIYKIQRDSVFYSKINPRRPRLNIVYIPSSGCSDRASLQIVFRTFAAFDLDISDWKSSHSTPSDGTSEGTERGRTKQRTPPDHGFLSVLGYPPFRPRLPSFPSSATLLSALGYPLWRGRTVRMFRSVSGVSCKALNAN